MKIAYFGADIFFGCMQHLLENGHEIVRLFSHAAPKGQYDVTQKTCKLAAKHNIPIQREKPTDTDVSALDCDLILSAGYPFKVPDWQASNARYGVNIHPSLLPTGAGPMPIPYIVLKGLSQSGVTLHKLSQEWDAGELLLQQAYAVSRQDNMSQLYAKTQKTAVELLANFLKKPQEYWENSTPQNRQKGDYWSLPAEGGFIINYQETVDVVEKQLRTHYFIKPDGVAEYITDVTFWKEFHTHPPGTTLLESAGLHLVAARDGYVRFKLVNEAPY